MDDENTLATFSAVVPMTHPSIAGHFPGTPVVPGVVILDAVLDKIESWLGLNNLQSITNVKFVAPLLPDQLFVISIERPEQNTFIFICHRKEEVIAQGKILYLHESAQ